MKQKVGSCGYRALTRIWHSKDNRYYEAGDLVALDHLPPSVVLQLLSRGVIALEGKGGPRLPLEAIKGIGPEVAKALWHLGIRTPQELIAADSARLETRLGLVTVEEIETWQKAARAQVDTQTPAGEDRGSGTENKF